MSRIPILIHEDGMKFSIYGEDHHETIDHKDEYISLFISESNDSETLLFIEVIH